MWHDWDPSKEIAEEGEEYDASAGAVGLNGDAQVERRKDYRDVVVTNIDPTNGRIKIQEIGTGTAARKSLSISCVAKRLLTNTQ